MLCILCFVWKRKLRDIWIHYYCLPRIALLLYCKFIIRKLLKVIYFMRNNVLKRSKTESEIKSIIDPKEFPKHNKIFLNAQFYKLKPAMRITNGLVKYIHFLGLLQFRNYKRKLHMKIKIGEYEVKAFKT